MAELTFTGARLARVSSLGDQIVFPVVPRRRLPTGLAQVKLATFAGGVVRANRTPGGVLTIQYHAVQVDAPDVNKLDSWRGLPVLYRDELRNADFGVLQQVTGGQTEESMSGNHATVRFALTITTHDERSFA